MPGAKRLAGASDRPTAVQARYRRALESARVRRGEAARPGEPLRPVGNFSRVGPPDRRACRNSANLLRTHRLRQESLGREDEM